MRAVFVFRIMIFVLFTFLAARFIDLKIIKGHYLSSLAEGNRIRRVRIAAPRGKILSRSGEVLVGNAEVYKKIVDSENGPVKIAMLSKEESENVFTEFQRQYAFGTDLGHVTGYLGEVNPEELGKLRVECPEKGVNALGSLIGRSGLEKEYDCLLSGIDGEQLVEVDTSGKIIRMLGRKLPLSGTDLKTTLNLRLQRKVAELLADQKGSVIVSDPSGEILALYSAPSFDPNKNISDHFSDQDLPLFNRAISGKYAPGSVFKIVTAAAALEEGKVDDQFRYIDNGVIRVGEFSYYNWYFTQYGKTEGNIDLVRAIARSTDTFFYKLGELVGPAKLSEWAEKFGVGVLSGIDLPGEAHGLLPSPAWKRAVVGERWFLGNTFHFAIGQGDLSMTPLEVNLMTAVIASDGKKCVPHLVYGQADCQAMGLKRETLEVIKKGMLGACQTGGTAYPFFDFEPRVACKTGTAEISDDEETHAWFTAFAPASPPGEPMEFPEIVVTVLIEKGGEGSKVAAPIAKEIFDFWFYENN